MVMLIEEYLNTGLVDKNDPVIKLYLRREKAETDLEELLGNLGKYTLPRIVDGKIVLLPTPRFEEELAREELLRKEILDLNERLDKVGALMQQVEDIRPIDAPTLGAIIGASLWYSNRLALFTTSARDELQMRISRGLPFKQQAEDVLSLDDLSHPFAKECMKKSRDIGKLMNEVRTLCM